MAQIFRFLIQSGSALTLCAALVACSSASNENNGGTGGGTPNGVKPGATDFISVVPGSDGDGAEQAGDGDGATADAAGSGGSGNSADEMADPGGEAAARAIEEADILKVDGDRLYALSRYSGLSVIDISDRKALSLIGSHRTSATPFEMYVDGDRAYVMYNGWGQYRYLENGYWSYEVSSVVQALDLTDPQAIAVLGEFELPGEVSDSRKVGDILYLVTFENGYCYGCEDNANTRVASFDLSDADAFPLIDELRLVEKDNSWGKRSISVTSERIYVSGWSWNQDDTGVINVVDITDPKGQLEKGAELSIAGPIESRWQMDEHEGTLRVISQAGGWNSGSPPIVETFLVESATKVTPMASLEMVLPRPEDLRSVRFDGERAYAITFERTDPLFTLDLSDPSNPQQLGELEIPGWVYHMEPRGDRIYALGFDDDDSEGALHVSLFDVSDLQDPQQLARVNFGGRWAQFAEDQDRIHKAFGILEDEGLILVPFAGWDYDESDQECDYRSEYLSGIQLVDMTQDSLTLRGVAPQVGQARRGFLVEGTLFGLSDNAVQTFDISDRDDPEGLDRLELARNVSDIQALSDADGNSTLLRFGSDWWTEETILDFAEMELADRAEPLGDVDLSDVVTSSSSCNSSSHWEGNVYVAGNYAYVPLRTYRWGGEDEYRQSLTFYVVNIEDRTRPHVESRFLVETEENDEYLVGIVQTDSALLVGRRTYDYDEDGYRSHLSYDIFSLEDPAKPQLAKNLEVPSDIYSYGWGMNYGGCSIDMGWGWWYGGGSDQAMVSGDLVVSQHRVPLEDGTGRVRYYLDRLDVSDPSKPKLLEPVNIPGGLVDFEEKTGRIVTSDYDYEEYEARDWAECEFGYFDYDKEVCRVYRRNLNTLELDGNEARLLDRFLVDEGNHFANSVAVSDDRVFALYFDSQQTQQMRSFRLKRDGKFEELGQVDLENHGWYGQLVARNGRAFISSYGTLTVVDATDEDDITVKSHEMGGYFCNSLEVAGDRAYCALGYRGVESFSLK